MAVKKSKIDKMPARKMPEGFEFQKYKSTRPSKEQIARNRQRAPGMEQGNPEVVAQIYAQARANASKSAPAKPVKAVKRATAAKPIPLGTPSPKPVGRRPAPKPATTKKPIKMTPEDAAMKKILEKKYGKIYG